MARPRNDEDEAGKTQAVLEDAQERHRQAQQNAVDSGSGLAVVTTRAVPAMSVEVLDSVGISHEGIGYGAGDVFTLDGPTALALLQAGYIKIKGTA